MTDEKMKKIKMAEYLKSRYDRLKEQGLCVSCGKPRDYSGSTVRCKDCCMKNTVRNSDYYYQKKKKEFEKHGID
jgi:hypothetical protein